MYCKSCTAQSNNLSEKRCVNFWVKQGAQDIYDKQFFTHLNWFSPFCLALSRYDSLMKKSGNESPTIDTKSTEAFTLYLVLAVITSASIFVLLLNNWKWWHSKIIMKYCLIARSVFRFAISIAWVMADIRNISSVPPQTERFTWFHNLVPLIIIQSAGSDKMRFTQVSGE